MRTTDEPDRAIRDALRILEVDHLLLAIHDRSFPAADDDVGVGVPSSEAGRRFLGFVRELGFTGVQLGPPGETSEGNPSPYDGTLFSRSRLSISLARLVATGVLAPATLERLVTGRPTTAADRMAFAYAHRAGREACREAYAAFAAGAGGPDLAHRVAEFSDASRPWLEHDAAYEALTEAGGDAAATARRYAFEQYLVHAQHRELRDFARRLGLELWGDLQIGFSPRDVWAWNRLFLAGYALGAPPSRTNPEGQPWGYPVLDPGQPEAVERFVATRLDKMFTEFDGVRIDHPHGYVCPWVYRADTADPQRAVQQGARLFSSPDFPDHPVLARFAIVGRAQLNPDPRTPRHADDWVVEITPAQLERYDRLMAVVVESARRHGGEALSSLACEVLSTCPFPLRRILERHGLGRFRITQKANLRDPADVYRAENAGPADWLMVGTHDTTPLWLLLEEWERDGSLAPRADYLAWRLAPDPAGRARLARQLAASPGLLAQAQFADLLASRARHVKIFFADAFGVREVYNQGGIVAEGNWTLRLAPDYRRRHAERAAAGQALDLPTALAMALRSRGRALTDQHRGLLGRLDTLAVR